MNPKHLERGIDIIQLETAVGAAIQSFKGACGKVPWCFDLTSSKNLLIKVLEAFPVKSYLSNLCALFKSGRPLYAQLTCEE